MNTEKTKRDLTEAKNFKENELKLLTQNIIKFYTQGLTINELSTRLNKSRNIISMALAKLGLVPHKKLYPSNAKELHLINREDIYKL